MTSQASSHHVTNDQIRLAVAEIAKSVDLEETSLKKMQRMIAQKLGVDIDDLKPKKDFIKKCIEEQEENASSSASSSSSKTEKPTEDEIREAATTIMSKIDMTHTTFKRFVKMVEDEMDCDGLTSSEAIKDVYENGKSIDGKIVKATKKLAKEVDVLEISNHNFFAMLQEKAKGIDLLLKKDLVYRTLEECKQKRSAKVHNEVNISDISSGHNSSAKKEHRMEAEEAMAMCTRDNNHCKPTPKEDGKYLMRSLDLEQGMNIPEAAGMTWTDKFFGNDTDDLVAVFDHNYKGMLWYHLKFELLTKILPAFFIVLTIAILIVVASSSMQNQANTYTNYYSDFYDEPTVQAGMNIGKLVGGILVVIDLIDLPLTTYGQYRLLKSQIYSLHLAVKRDGICCVQDNHIASRIPLVAALHIFDACLFVSKQSQTIPFDQVTELTVNDPGDIDKTCCCWFCCILCFRIPYYKIAIDTASSWSGARYCDTALQGLKTPHEFHKLVWGMKRDKGEEIHRRAEKNTEMMMSAMMFDNVMKYGMSPVQPPLPGMVGGNNGAVQSIGTAPTMSMSSASTPVNTSQANSSHHQSRNNHHSSSHHHRSSPGSNHHRSSPRKPKGVDL